MEVVIIEDEKITAERLIQLLHKIDPGTFIRKERIHTGSINIIPM